MPALDLKSRLGHPIAPVRPDDLKRVTSFLVSQQPASEPRGPEPPATGVSFDILAGLCSQGADVVAVWFRSVLLMGALRLRESFILNDRVFEVGAGCPLPNGVATLDLEALLNEMERPGSAG